jgi:UDP-2-acetamido-3-amino-2,3-dideoxy-glucuronate N-acetyltransferase
VAHVPASPPDPKIGHGGDLGEGVFIHPTAIVETTNIGSRTRVWAFTHILEGAEIGADCNIGGHCYIEAGVRVGNRVTVKNANALWEGVTLEDGVFVGPSVVFTNDRRPRSPRNPEVARSYASRDWLLPTLVREGATLGAGAILLPGLLIGEYAFVAAGSLVASDVPPHALVRGSPARMVAWVCRCGEKLEFEGEQASCVGCGLRFQRDGDVLSLLRWKGEPSRGAGWNPAGQATEP